MIISRDHDAIIAQCTPRGSGAIALLRISGTHARKIATLLSKLPGNVALEHVPTHTVHYGHVIDEHKTAIDQVLFLVMDGPKSFTGDDTIEITCHNNPFLIEAITERALKCGARMAEPGEFTRRAFLNKKIDLLQAEAINELIHASNHLALKQSLSQLNGSFSQWITQLEKKLVTCFAYCEASFEFLDEEMEFGSVIKEQLLEISASIDRIKKAFDQQHHVRQGLRVALIGSVNAGKSSLFNALLKEQRAIVAPIAGTTRDSIESSRTLHGSIVTFIDTAGLRQTNDSIEQEGIKRSQIEAQKADIILLILDSSREITQQEKYVYDELRKHYPGKIILVESKTDMPRVNSQIYNAAAVLVSDKNSETIAALEIEIGKKINELFSRVDSPFLLNQRHYRILLKIEEYILNLLQMLEKPEIAYELVSAQLKDTLEILTELSGKTISEQAMDAVFREFCVGK
ncbi:MAG TPA: tRNA uridine-5-carboxymethylaminomethyl(34) synthesis GTPase MnmE [Candidatus Babeliales bacterium]|nr:tRNA uridine-5-carboxymethylaminomethyl(34) synthesis GTPase MnmE [Candidatus Babeliales bacterium]